MPCMWHAAGGFESLAVAARRAFRLCGRRMDPRLARHFDACNNAGLPGERIAFAIGAAQVGWVRPDWRVRWPAFPA